MTVRVLSPHEDARYMALRARLAVDATWLNPATFTLTPVAHDTDSGPVDCDRWGRIYINFDQLDPNPATAADQIAAAIADWLNHTTRTLPHHVPVDDDRFPTSTSNVDIVARRVADSVAATSTRSTLGGHDWAAWAAQVRGTTTPHWTQILAGHMRRATSTRRGNVDYTYTRPGRRHIPGVVTPARVERTVNVAVIADISGSVNDHLTMISTEIGRIAQASSINTDAMRVFAVDDEVAWERRWTNTLEFASRAGHLTDMRAGIDAAARRRPAADVIIVVTDGITPWPDERPAGAVIVCLVGPTRRNEHAAANVPTWAHTVTIDTATLAPQMAGPTVATR